MRGSTAGFPAFAAVVLLTGWCPTPALAATATEGAGPYATVLFQDDFSAPSLGSAWKLFKSESTIRDGVLVTAEPDGAGHSAVNSVSLKPTKDIQVTLRCRFEGAKGFAIAFNDGKFKGSHAGHICRATFSPTKVVISDDKTGIFANEIYDAKQKGSLSQAQKDLLKTKSADFPVKLEPKTWYTVTVETTDDRMRVLIDGKAIGELTSEGFAHATKDKPALVVPGKFIHFDDVDIRAR
jgi:hypothetical protein